MIDVRPALRRVAFRVDASIQIGTGHLVRCLALAHGLRKAGVESLFVMARLLPQLRAHLQDAGFETRMIPCGPERLDQPFYVDQQADSRSFLEVIDGISDVGAVIVDHYGLDSAWEARVRNKSRRVMAIDDLADRTHDADWLLDQSLPSPARIHDRWLPAHCRRLLGPKFALLRGEFASLRTEMRPHRDRRRALLFVGGADPDDITSLALRAWSQVKQPRPPLDVVIGGSHPARTRIQAAVTSLPDVQLHIQTQAMGELLAQTKLFVGSAGTISWERCCLGVPAIMFSIADNQDYNLSSLAAARTGISLGKASRMTSRALSNLISKVLSKPGLMERMARRSANLVDGRGSERAALMLASGNLALRMATDADARRAWSWRNAPSTRLYFRNPGEVAFEEHMTWWSRTLADPHRKLFIAHCGEYDVGVLRLDTESDEAEVSIYLDPDLTGLGLGSLILLAAQRAVTAGDLGVSKLRAEILPENLASESAFRNAGFQFSSGLWHWPPP